MADQDFARVTPQIVPLSELDDFKVAEGDPDIRGWDVLAADGTKVGDVEDLLVDTGSMKVRYLEVDLDNDRFGEDRHVLVPIGQARLDDDNDNVLVDGIQADAFATLPAYTRGAFSRDYETSLRQGFAGTAGAASTTAATASTDESDFYAHRDFDESRFLGSRRRGTAEREGALRVTRSEEELAIGKRAVEAGEVEVTKRIETERVRESVPVTREEVVIERHAVEAGAAADTQLEEGEIRVPIMEEEVIVEKRVVPKEEVVIRKEAVQDERVVEDTVRKERLEVDDQTKTPRGGGTRQTRDDEERRY